MSASVALQLSQFGLDVAQGLGQKQKQLPAQYFYDELGSTLFEAITALPEYGLTRADERILAAHADHIAKHVSYVQCVAELGSGSGRKTKHILKALTNGGQHVVYFPIDVSRTALATCQRELESVSRVQPVCAEWTEGLTQITARRTGNDPILLLFLGSSIGNFERAEIAGFLGSLKKQLRVGDFFLLGADLIKHVDRMLAAYDDPTGVTAAFNRNLLGRINRELDADFDLASFSHEARWNNVERRIEMHLVARRNQVVCIRGLDLTVPFRASETIWTESSHKFTEDELDEYARTLGFRRQKVWVDEVWSFAECLWEVE
jgi:L-histidine Nalpha-methyltransferase